MDLDRVKYLKYKHKYLKLKKQLSNLQTNSHNNLQSGGYSYSTGKYLFFIPKRTSPIVDTIPPNKQISNFEALYLFL